MALALPEVLGSSERWQFAFSFAGLPALLLCLILPFCPESPKYSLMKLNKCTLSLIDTFLIGEKRLKEFIFIIQYAMQKSSDFEQNVSDNF